MEYVVAFTDGGCKPNPGRGGWGVVLRYKGKEKELCGGEHGTTNNRMEMMAAIQALRALKRPMPVIIFTDSKYLRNGITSWIARWKRNGWKTQAKKDVVNKDLWVELDRLCKVHQVTWQWVKGHSNVEGNERADTLARQGRLAAQKVA